LALGAIRTRLDFDQRVVRPFRISQPIARVMAWLASEPFAIAIP
jgi:hypothetical protein